VTLISSSFQATTVADANGMYLISGVPEGVVVATANLGGGFLSGTATAPLSGDGSTLTLNVALRSSGTVAGQGLQTDGITPVPSSSVTITVGGSGGGTLSTLTDAQGHFSFDRVPAGSGAIAVQVLG